MESDLQERLQHHGSVPVPVDLMDGLTGLPGRKAAFAMLARAIAGAKRSGAGMLVALIDLDRFYVLNETQGTAFGDEVLRLIAKRLFTYNEFPYKACRLGGNTFVLLHKLDLQQEEHDLYVEHLKASLEQVLNVRGQLLYPTCSIGISSFPRVGETAEMLIRHADTALQHAKEAGGNRISAYTGDDVIASRRMLFINEALRDALNNKEFSLHYQPIYKSSGQLRGFEALLRWHHPMLGQLSPAEFIPLAEQSGLIVPIGEWVMEEACKMLRRAQDKGLSDIIIAVNLSPLQLRAPRFIDTVLHILRQTQTPANCLELEITESMMIDASEAALSILNRLREMGIRIALDDFGTGYASLTYLRQLPLHTLKLDRSFIRFLCKNDADRIIVRSMIALVHQLGLEVVAEGIETGEQLDVLQEWGCDFYQGYLLGKPIADEEIELGLMTWTMDDSYPKENRHPVAANVYC